MSRTLFNQVNIVAADVDATIGFYRQLGVDLEDPARTSAGEAFHANSRGPGGSLEVDSPDFARVWNQGWKDVSNLAGRLVIGLRVEDRAAVDHLYARIVDAGHKGLQPPFDAFWGARYAVVEDPDGNAVGLMSPRDADGRAAPPF